jgi:acyl carrier protein
MPDVTFGLEELRHIMVQRVGLADDAVPQDPETTFAELGLDSLARVEVVLAIQQYLGIRVPDDTAQRVVTFQELIDAVTAPLAGGEVIAGGAHR